MIHFRLESGNCCFAIHGTGNKCSMQPKFFSGHLTYMLVNIIRCICKGSKDQHFLVSRIDGGRCLLPDHTQQLVQFEIIFRCDILDH